MLPQHGADKWDSPSALSKHGGAAIRAGRGGGVPLSPSRTPLGPGWPAGQLPTCGIAQEKNNAGFGRNEGTLVVLAEPPTQGKVALCSVVAAAGVLSGRALGETRHTKGQLLLLMRTPQEVTKDSWSSFQLLTESGPLPQCRSRQLCLRDCFSGCSWTVSLAGRGML